MNPISNPIPKTREIFRDALRVTVKVGTETILKNGSVHKEWLDAFAQDIASLKDAGKEAFIITSGAIGIGRGILGINPQVPTKNLPMPLRQKAAMVGQIHLMMAYDSALAKHGLFAGQGLLTKDMTENEKQVSNLQNASLIAVNDSDLVKRIVPIYNENDAVATDEISFGDNDGLGAIVTNILDADLFVILSEIDGLYTDNPKLSQDAQHIPYVPNIRSAFRFAHDDLSGLSRGGMTSKLRAVEIATDPRYASQIGVEKKPGATVILAKGKDEIGCLGKLFSEGDTERRNTIFPPQPLPQRGRHTQGLEA